MALWNYSPDQINILIAGFHNITGFSENTFISIRKDSPNFTTNKSADGLVERVVNPDKSYIVEITLSQSSSSNDFLTRLLELDMLTRAGKFPIFVKDYLGSSLFISPSAWITTPPETIFSNSMESRVWQIQCADCISHIGGGNGSDGAIDILNELLAGAPELIGLL